MYTKSKPCSWRVAFCNHGHMISALPLGHGFYGLLFLFVCYVFAALVASVADATAAVPLASVVTAP
jgi:hypothetical protein